MTLSHSLSPAEADAFGAELDAIRREVVADRGRRDVDHIQNVVRTAHYGEAAGRLLLHFGLDPLSFTLGVAALATAKILENMEIGHNVMHGQYDWTGDPALQSQSYEWDTACTGDDWRHDHNYEHHTYTNVLGKDRDVGYGLIRVSREQPWDPIYSVQPISALLLALGFQWGVGAYALRFEEVLRGKASLGDLAQRAQPFLRKAGWQLTKDYIFFPALALWNAPRVLAGNFLANVIRNVWSFSIIFCGHFPEGVRVYEESEARDESRGQWYVRQVNGSANIEGGWLFHVLTGHLSHQIEHHLFPDLPAARYPEIAPRVRQLCERFGQTYNTGSFFEQFGSVVGRIIRYARPDPAPLADSMAA
jgi:linoleoyl-CoA desaturase